MSTITKTLLGLLVAALVIVAVAVYLLASNLDGIVKQLIEDVGTETSEGETPAENSAETDE